MVRYDKLWETMKARDMSQYKLIHVHRFSSGQINRLKRNMYVSTRTIDKLCEILNCQPGDILEVIREPEEDSQP